MRILEQCEKIVRYMGLWKLVKKKITQEKSTHKEDINMEILNKNYLQEPKNLNRSVHGARGQKLKFRMTNASTLKKSGYQREANYIEMKPTI